MKHLRKHKWGFPLERYEIAGSGFGKRCSYGGVDWGIHLGEDVKCENGTEVLAIGKGKVVYAKLHPGTSEKSNWGNVVIISHKNSKTKQTFYSLYGHLGKLFVKEGDTLKAGQVIGIIGKSNTPENGWWPIEHLHFGIYTGLWQGKVLPGYFREDQNRTKLEFWEKPSEFIAKS